MTLEEKYEVSFSDIVISKLKGSRVCPDLLYNYSKKWYGNKDNLARYYTE